MEASDHLKDKTAIVTGAGRGIGRAIAKRLAAAGANVTIAARTSEQLEETRGLIEGAGGSALAITADVSKVDEVDRMVGEARSRFGGIDILVNNAGVAPLGTIEQMEPETFDHLVSTNIRAVYLCSRAVWPSMASGGGGAIVNIASVAAYDAFPGFAAYGAAKAFVVAYTKSLAVEGASCGIRTYGVAPGAVETDMLRAALPDFPADQALAADEVAALVASILSPAYRHSSGQTIVLKK